MVKIDSIEQKDYINDVQIVGLEESVSEGEDAKKLIKLAKEKMGMKLKKTDVKSVHRLGKKPSKGGVCRDLVVSFKDQPTRELFYNNRKKVATSKLPHQNIYVNDKLTNHRKGLFYQARKLYKSRKLFAAWTQKGNILVRLKEDSPIIQVNNYADMRRLRETNSMQDSSLHTAETISELSDLSDYDFYVDS